MTTYLQLIFLSLAGGVFSLIGGILLLTRRKLADKLAQYATPFAAGALLAAVFLDLLKDGLEEASVDTVLMATLIGMVLFFFAERFLHWFHHHNTHEHAEDFDPTTKPLIIVGDTIHNAMDGVAIAAAFLISPVTGVITTIAVAAHEIPQEIGDFGLLLAKGMRRRNVILVNVLSALATTVFAVVTFALGDADILPIGFLLGLSAGFLLYIAASDIIPDIHEQTPKHKLFEWRALLLLAGVLTVGVSVNLAHRYIHVEHEDEHDASPIVIHEDAGKH
jgi:zinc and cadmium transporter